MPFNLTIPVTGSVELDMLRGLAILLALAVGGCASRSTGVFIAPAEPQTAGSKHLPPNLALGPSAEHVWLGLSWAGRSAWPSVPAGYRLDDVTYFSDFQDDQQFYFGRFGGYYRTAVMFRSAVVLR